MANLIARLRDWLLQNRPFQTAWLEKDTAYESDVETSFAALPKEIAQQLNRLVKDLPSHPDDQQVIQTSVSTAVEQWQAEPGFVNNSLVVVSSPVSAITRILTDSSADWSKQHEWSINLLDWIERPINAAQIQEKLSQSLGQTGAKAAHKNVAVIPNLSWCYLRSSEGLDGIDYLRDELLSDRTQFWVIGGGQVGWQYLNSILKLEAHCGDVVQLPKLSGEQLQNWLMPIIDQLQIHFDQTSIQERLQELGNEKSTLTTLTTAWDEIRTTVKSQFQSAQQEAQAAAPNQKSEDNHWIRYFERLSDLSGGVSTIALQLFVQSIQYEELEKIPADQHLDQTDIKEIKALFDPEPPPPHRLVARLPRLPKLPSLEQDDLYILYSLLVHGDLTIDALAESLGEERQIVNDQVQVLRKTSLIEQQGQVVKVNPVHYPRIKQRLTGNNFIVEGAP